MTTSRTDSALLLAVIGLVAGLSAGCGGDDIDQFNQTARITSVGPISMEDSSVVVDYTLLDREGDDQTISVGVCTAENAEADSCPTPVQGVEGDGRTLLPTVPRDTDVPHRFAWSVGCGRVADGMCLDTDVSTDYVFRLQVEGSDRVVTSREFSLEESFGLDALPDCDTTIPNIPEPCDPMAEGSNP